MFQSISSPGSRPASAPGRFSRESPSPTRRFRGGLEAHACKAGPEAERGLLPRAHVCGLQPQAPSEAPEGWLATDAPGWPDKPPRAFAGGSLGTPRFLPRQPDGPAPGQATPLADAQGSPGQDRGKNKPTSGKPAAASFICASPGTPRGCETGAPASSPGAKRNTAQAPANRHEAGGGRPGCGPHSGTPGA